MGQEMHMIFFKFLEFPFFLCQTIFRSMASNITVKAADGNISSINQEFFNMYRKMKVPVLPICQENDMAILKFFHQQTTFHYRMATLAFLQNLPCQ